MLYSLYKGSNCIQVIRICHLGFCLFGCFTPCPSLDRFPSPAFAFPSLATCRWRPICCCASLSSLSSLCDAHAAIAQTWGGLFFEEKPCYSIARCILLIGETLFSSNYAEVRATGPALVASNYLRYTSFINAHNLTYILELINDTILMTPCGATRQFLACS